MISKLKHISWFIKHTNDVWRRFRPWLIRPKHLIFLFGSPGHSNLGDQAQTYCIEKWLKQNYPNYSIRIFTLSSSTPDVFVDLRRFIRKNDILVCHSGYHMTDLYSERLPYMKLAKKFPDYKITIFPQTFYFKDQSKLKETADAFNNHGNTTIMCRDNVSYEIAKQSFTNCRLMLMPDIVTSLIGTMYFDYERNGVLFCIRNDVETFYNERQISALRSRFSDVKTDITDTTLPIQCEEIAKNREAELFNVIEEYAHYKVVITDRYHGTIISLIAGTPVVVIGSTDHKLSSGVKWFPKEFSEYICFAENLDKAYNEATTMLTNNNYTHRLPPYFKTKYFDNLKRMLQQ